MLHCDMVDAQKCRDPAALLYCALQRTGNVEDLHFLRLTEVLESTLGASFSRNWLLVTLDGVTCLFFIFLIVSSRHLNQPESLCRGFDALI